MIIRQVRTPKSKAFVCHIERVSAKPGPTPLDAKAPSSESDGRHHVLPDLAETTATAQAIRAFSRCWHVQIAHDEPGLRPRSGDFKQRQSAQKATAQEKFWQLEAPKALKRAAFLDTGNERFHLSTNEVTGRTHCSDDVPAAACDAITPEEVRGFQIYRSQHFAASRLAWGMEQQQHQQRSEPEIQDFSHFRLLWLIAQGQLEASSLSPDTPDAKPENLYSRPHSGKAAKTTLRTHGHMDRKAVQVEFQLKIFL